MIYPYSSLFKNITPTVDKTNRGLAKCVKVRACEALSFDIKFS